MVQVFDQLSNALLAETGAKRLIKNNTQTSKQQINKQCSISIKEQAAEIGQLFTHICIVNSTKANQQQLGHLLHIMMARSTAPPLLEYNFAAKHLHLCIATSYSSSWLALAG